MFSQIFIERPRLAMVVSIIITLAGLIALFNIPVAQYPEITPPVIRVTAIYPGANAQVVADTVAAPIEKEVNGVDNMLYMSSTASNDGRYELSVTFAVGTDPDIDQVNLQNRVQLATSKLPKEVVDQGIDVRKRSASMMAVVCFYSPKSSRDRLFLSNYVSKNIKDTLVRLKGVSDAFIFGELEYSMRIWMDPDRLTALGLTADDVTTAIRQQNIQAAVGSVGSEPVADSQQVQYTLRTRGRLEDVRDFENIVVRTNARGGLLRLGDIARVELGARTYGHRSILNGGPTVALALYRSPGANALDTMKEVRSELDRLAQRQPSDVEYRIILDTTKYVSAAIHEIEFTLVLTFVLVVAVIFIFLQDWRASLIPTVTVPVSLIGTFGVLLALGYNANTVSLFALIMAIGLVVDDAIVVVENVHRVMQEEDLDAKAAAIKAMGQVIGPIIATTLVLLAVFVPVGFMPGISGQLYRQFAVTICTSVVISAINALTLSPALCATLLRPPRAIRRGPLAWFNRALAASRRGYVTGTSWLIRRLLVVLLLLTGIFASSYFLFTSRPTSFLPKEDQGYFFVNVQLPEAASLARTSEVLQLVTRELQSIKGVDNVIGVSGFSLLSGNADNVGFGIGILAPWDKRTRPDLQLGAIMGQAQRKVAAIFSANIFAFTPPAILGLGTTGGFDFRLQALEDQSPMEIAATTRALVIAANQDPVLMGVFSTYTANTPQLFVNLDRTRAEYLKVPVSRVFSTLQAQLGSRYVNDFNLYKRVYQVKVQADALHRDSEEDIALLYVRSNDGNMVPMRSLLSLSTVLAPQIVKRYNQFASVQINGNAAPGFSSGNAMAAMERLAAKTLPQGYGYDWSSMSFQERKAGGKVSFLFGLALLFGYLFLVGQYESWTIPLPIIVYIPVATLGALIGLWVAGLSLSIYAQIGLVLLVGLASKNAILIVEFSRDRRQEGLSVEKAAVEGARIRFRPVLMTAFTFILGVTPMLIATGAGANSRRHIGTTVFSGMLMATLVGIFLIPPLYFAFQSFREKGHAWRIRRRKEAAN
ncbi:MAG: multidrug efflux RND transporter permease subunit [Deltaproteobacteria bacterium]|nr:multidrug efflux RND transporter permease subunit [Deltaproteobacteria bacterium]MBW2070289.1 multidrug efflux RND transporter permease subunit [Deltaproteobacteria bacterium]